MGTKMLGIEGRAGSSSWALVRAKTIGLPALP